MLFLYIGITEANVYGVAIPHHEGRGCMAAIVVAPEFDFADCYKYVKQNLPSYARPIFLRLTSAMDITGTFKHQKVEFRLDSISEFHAFSFVLKSRNQGFDPSKTSDPIYVADTHAETYVRVDGRLFEEICSNKLKSKL
jgi:fatty-acyl-CoA synthase